MPPPIFLVAGARPNFVKLAPVERALRARGRIPFEVVHTGQHYDSAMSDDFFQLLAIPAPDHHLGVGSGSHGAQTASILQRFEQLLLEQRARAVVVFGDVNSTLACALAAAKLTIPIAHVEAGLRSFDRAMPEEINRVVTDALADLLLVSEPSGTRNLLAEGRPAAAIREVGNVMIDSLDAVRDRVAALAPWQRLGLTRGGYGFVTLHRQDNVDDPDKLRRTLTTLADLAAALPLVFAAHPRTRQRLAALGWAAPADLQLTEPLNYLDSIAMQRDAVMVLTDSGGMQEESSHLNVPCLTLRDNTERPITVELGTNTLVGSEPTRLRAILDDIRAGRHRVGRPIPLWDGRAAERAAAAIEEWLETG